MFSYILSKGSVIDSPKDNWFQTNDSGELNQMRTYPKRKKWIGS